MPPRGKAADKTCTPASPNTLPGKIRLQAAKTAAAPCPFKSQSRIPVHLSDSSPALPAPCRILPAHREGIAAVPHFLAFAIAPHMPRRNPSVPALGGNPICANAAPAEQSGTLNSPPGLSQAPGSRVFSGRHPGLCETEPKPCPPPPFFISSPFFKYPDSVIATSRPASPPPGCAQADKKRAGRMSGPKIIRLSASC